MQHATILKYYFDLRLLKWKTVESLSMFKINVFIYILFCSLKWELIFGLGKPYTPNKNKAYHLKYHIPNNIFPAVERWTVLKNQVNRMCMTNKTSAAEYKNDRIVFEIWISFRWMERKIWNTIMSVITYYYVYLFHHFRVQQLRRMRTLL